MRFFHTYYFRDKRKNGVKVPISYAVTAAYDRCSMALAICSTKDKFSKKHGRLLASYRLYNNDSWDFPLNLYELSNAALIEIIRILAETMFLERDTIAKENSILDEIIEGAFLNNAAVIHNVLFSNEKNLEKGEIILATNKAFYDEIKCYPVTPGEKIELEDDEIFLYRFTDEHLIFNDEDPIFKKYARNRMRRGLAEYIESHSFYTEYPTLRERLSLLLFLEKWGEVSKEIKKNLIKGM